MKIYENHSLKPHNSFGVEARTDFFVDLDGTNDIYELLATGMCSDLPWMVIGEGSNILFTKNYPGLIVRLNNSGIQILSESDETIRIHVGAGRSWDQFVQYCVRHQYWGTENLAGIPGTVGSAPIQNIGAYGLEVKDAIESVQGVFPGSGELVSLDVEECQFQYRSSIFKTSLKNQFIITSVIFKLGKKPNPVLSYEPLRMAFNTDRTPDIKAITSKIIEIRKDKLPDPGLLGNAGSFFKNPEIPEIFLKNLQINDPQIPFFVLPGNRFKIPAAWLIEKAGWKGKQVGRVGVYENHALVIVNHGGATGTEIYDFSNMIRESVFRSFGIDLEPEVLII